MDPSLDDQILPFFDPKKPPLSTEETSAAVNSKLIAFPEVIRSLNDPQLNTETFVLLSFLKSNDHSYVKVRGYGDLESCKEKAKQIVKSIDSRLPIAIAKLGQWCYVTSEPNKLSKETIKLIDDKEITQQEHVDLLLSEHEKNTALNEKPITRSNDEEKSDITVYIRRKVMMYETYKQIQFLNMKLSLLNERQTLLLHLNDNQRNEFEKEWYAEYLRQLLLVGIKDTNITSEKLKDIESEIPPLLFDSGDSKEKLKENEEKYNNLKYTTVDF